MSVKQSTAPTNTQQCGYLRHRNFVSSISIKFPNDLLWVRVRVICLYKQYRHISTDMHKIMYFIHSGCLWIHLNLFWEFHFLRIHVHCWFLQIWLSAREWRELRSFLWTTVHQPDEAGEGQSVCLSICVLQIEFKMEENSLNFFPLKSLNSPNSCEFMNDVLKLTCKLCLVSKHQQLPGRKFEDLWAYVAFWPV